MPPVPGRWSHRMRPHGVTTLELFFDLVFVFALTQVTVLMADDPTARGLGRGLVLLALLWFGWTPYAWLGNQAHVDEHDLGDALPWVPVLALYGGAVLYLVALSALRRRNIGGWNRQRLLASAGVLLVLIAYEATRLATERDRIRHRTRHDLRALTEPDASLAAARARSTGPTPAPGR